MSMQSRADPPAPEPVRFAALDSWRGIAAVMVVLFHSPIASHVREWTLVRSSEAFVDFFFVLSGFVIAHAYAERIRSAEEFGRFAFLRLGRLVPLHLFVLALMVLFELAKAALPFLGNPADPAFSGANEPAYLVSNLLLLHAFWPAAELSWNAPSWSISAEFAAYVVFGLLALAGLRVLLLGLAAAAVLAPLLLAGFSGAGMEAAAGFGWARALFGFAFGAGLQLVAGPALLALRRGTEEAPRSGWTWVEAALVPATAVAAAATHGTAFAYLMVPLFALMVAVFAVEGGAVSRALRWRPMLLLGALSYSIYLVHVFVQLRMINAARALDLAAGTSFVSHVGHTARYGQGIDAGNAFAGDLLTLLMVACVIAVAFCTWRLVERPGQRWFRAHADKLFAGGVSPSNEKGRLSEAAF